jgi:hypothetical protein
MTSQNVQKRGVAAKEAILNLWRHNECKMASPFYKTPF